MKQYIRLRQDCGVSESLLKGRVLQMKIIKNCLFYLFLGLAIASTLVSVGVSGTTEGNESFGFFVLSLIALWSITASLWVIVIVGFRNQLADYLAKKRGYLEDDDEEYTEVIEYEEIHPRLRATYNQEFEDCYHLAVVAHADRVIAAISTDNLI